MNISDASLANLVQNVAVEITGKATTKGSKKARPIKAKAVPATNGSGSLMISVLTENGTLVFDTSYRFGEK